MAPCRLVQNNGGFESTFPIFMVLHD
jgi:hypothetical protein